MKLLLYTPCFPPDNAAYVHLIHDLANDMHSAGHIITVISSTTYGAPGGLGFRLWAWDNQQGVRVLRINTFPSRKKGLMRKAVGFAAFTILSFLAGLFISRPDLVFAASTPPTMGLVGGLVARLRRARFVYNVQDIFPDVAIKLGLLRSPMLIRLALWLERVSYSLADRVTVIGESFADVLKKKGTSPAKVTVIPNWIDTDALAPPGRDQNKFRKELGLEDRFVVIYAGNFGLSQGLETLVDAADSLQDLEQISWLLIGDGERSQALTEYLSDRPVRSIRILPFQPAERLNEVFGAADVGVVPLKRGLSSDSIPSKTWTMMAAGLPIVASIDRSSALATFIKEQGTGFVVEPESPKELAACVRELCLAPDDLRLMGEKSRMYTERNLSRKQMTLRYLQLFQQLHPENHVPEESEG